MALDHAKLAKELLEKVGGPENISSVTNCMTRLRFVLKDESIADIEEVESLEGVLRVIKKGGQYQVVIGNEVSKVYRELAKLGDFSESAPKEKSKSGSEEQENVLSRLFGFIAGCMTPLLPAMLGSGMIKVVLTLLTTFSLIDTSGTTYQILNVIGDAFFYFLPVMLAYTTAKKLDASAPLAMVIAAVLLHPDLTALLGEGNVSYFGLPVTSATYSSSVLPVLLIVPIMKYVEDFADRVSPDVVKAFLKPLIVVFITAPIALVIVGPIGAIMGQYLAAGINFLYNEMGWLTIMLLSALMPFIVMTGMHYALIPIALSGMSSFGFDAILIITMFCSNLAQGGATMAVAYKAKKLKVKSQAMAAGISAIVAGVTEPAMYGITLKYKTPMIAAVAGAGAAGLYAGITGLVAYTMGGSPSALSLIQMIGGEGFVNMINGVIALAISLAVSFSLSYVLFKPEEKSEQVKKQEEKLAQSV